MSCLAHKSLTKPLEASSIARLSARPERLDACRLERFGQACRQRPFRADDGEIDSFFLGESDEAVQLHRPNGHALGHLGNSGIPRRAIKLGRERARGQRPGQRMLAPAAADKKDIHGSRFRWRIANWLVSSPHHGRNRPTARAGQSAGIQRQRAVGRAQAHGRGRLFLCAGARRAWPRRAPSQRPLLFRPQGRPRGAGRRGLEGKFWPIAREAGAGAGSRLHRAADHVSRPIANTRSWSKRWSLPASAR